MSAMRMIVAAPRATLSSNLSRSLLKVVAAGASSLAVALWFAIRLSGNIRRSVEGLIEPALALGSGRPVELSGSTIVEADAVGRALKQASQMLAEANHQAHHDPLTGLCNRTLFDELVVHQLAAAERHGGRLAVIAIDLDGFKAVNDRHGHATGDAVLKTAADRIRKAIRGADVVSRRGGDEFTVLLNHVDQPLAQRIGHKLVATLARPYDGIDVAVSASVGIALYPGSGTTLAALLERADQALYDAKNGGKRRLAGDIVPGRELMTRLTAWI
jgi:diguanylate cyclase (GGDEF)-like protein